MKTINLSHKNSNLTGKIVLPASKSISNRLQVINALSGNKIDIQNLSAARDTQIMKFLLNDDSLEKNVQDAGTAMRFLTAYYALKGGNIILKGTERMHQRPIGILVDALNSLGANISYLDRNGFPPLKINSFTPVIACMELEIDSTISSQYISALLMIAPYLPTGLWLKMKGDISSKPYIKMTLGLMQELGINHKWIGEKININKGNYSLGNKIVESDWSAASYWYSFVCISDDAKIELKGLKENSLQGDSIVAELFEQLGVKTTFNDGGIIIEKVRKNVPKRLEIDFSDCPDLAQTLTVVCAVKGIELVMTGVESLKIKETNRLEALKNELSKIDVKLIEQNKEYIVKGKLIKHLPGNLVIKTYEDHRMAMAFAPLSLLGSISFDDESVVNKSYPSFWTDIENL